MESKICSTCKISKILIEFNKNIKHIDGLSYKCRGCNKKYLNQYYHANIGKFKQYQIDNAERLKQYRVNRVDKLKQYSQQYYNTNLDKLKQYQEKYYIENKDKVRERHKQYGKQYSIDNADKKKQYNKEYIQTENGKLYNRLKSHRRRNLLKTNTSSGKHWTPADIKLKLKLQHGKCVYCETSIKDYFEIDHFIPVVKGGSNEAWNIQLLCKDCNGSAGKGKRDAIEFGQEHNMLC